MPGGPTHDPKTLHAELITVRDWLRFAVSRFNAAGLAYGHGTDTALDEAAFLLLATLHLPIGDANPWLDARLTREERGKLADVIERRVVTRKPAAYLLGEAWIGPHRFRIDERVIVPRSFIGELIVAGLDGVAVAGQPVRRVVDLCTGSGCLAILAALHYPDALVDAADISKDAIAVARGNVTDYRLDKRVRLHTGDLFAPLEAGRYDLIIANPPYVTAAAVAAFAPEHAAEPALAHAGGADGMDIVRRILAEAGKWLAPAATLIVEIGQGRAVIERDYPDLAFLWLDTETSTGEVFALPASALGGARSRKPRRK